MNRPAVYSAGYPLYNERYLSMKLLITLFITLFIIMLAENSIRKHPSIWYLSAFLLSLLCLLLPSSVPVWLTYFANNIIGRGTLATALFILVMYARILPPKSRLFRTLMSLRAPLAIMAAFMILLHNGTYFIHYYRNISQRNISMTPLERLAACCTILMLILLIPLTITSFSYFRKKLKGKTWKNIQRLSYLFYALIYLHVACLFSAQILQGNHTYQRELAIYTAIFGIYLICRIALYLKAKRKNTAAKVLRNTGIPIVLVLSLSLVFIPFSKTPVPDDSEAETITLSEQPKLTEYQDGEWFGTALGYNDDITVKVTISSGKITNICIIESSDDEPYYKWAKEKIPQTIIDTQSTDIDAVSGATFSSKGIINAVSDALQKAQF